MMTSEEKIPAHNHQKICRVCKSEYWQPSHVGICDKCAYKIIIVIVVAMVVLSYMAWFGVL
jgi:hypothetical protein